MKADGSLCKSAASVSVYVSLIFCPDLLEEERRLGIFAMGVPHSLSAPGPRQIRVGPRLRAVCRSVVTFGTVQVSVTRFPLRAARRSVGGLGKSSEGGCGGCTVAHAVNKKIGRAHV